MLVKAVIRLRHIFQDWFRSIKKGIQKSIQPATTIGASVTGIAADSV